MSFQVSTTVETFPQKPFQFVPYFLEEDATFADFPVLGSLLSDLKHFWQAKGPCLEVRQVTTGRKVGSFTFGCVLKDTNTKIVAVEELKRSGGRLSLLVVALECALTGGVICIFDIFGSKVLRAVRIGEKISTIHVIDHGCDTVIPESSPLQYFDGLLAVGTSGGNVFLLDLCKQICENVLENFDLDVRGEVNNCQMVVLNKQKIQNIKKYIEVAVECEEHLAIHLNVVLDSLSEHFTLKGESGDDIVHVNKEEVEVSALFYAKQIASLFIGYNFGSFQMWDLRSLDLLYTSPLLKEIIPIKNFTIQEPADDPKCVCYIWVSFSHNLIYASGIPYAVMYAFYFHSKTLLNKYGSLYEDFQHCSIRFQLALGDNRSASLRTSVKGGICLGFQTINKNPTNTNKDLSSLELCFISWLFWGSDKIVNTAMLLFDLNQWYKEQMPSTPSWMHCSNYIIKNSMDKKMMSIKMDRKSLYQFMGIQRPEEHFCPTSLSFDLWAISEHSIFKMHIKGHQKFFLDKVINDQHLALVSPVNYKCEIINLGLVPLFYDIHKSEDADYQRELLLNVALEQNLVGWLCKVSSELANNSFSSAGLTLHNILHWAFQRAVAIKNSCDKYCVPLFDYSSIKLDNNILGFISCGTHQIRNLCSFYRYISSKLLEFVADREGFLEEQRSLENVVVYFEVLLWMVNIGLLPEFQAKSGASSVIGAPYLVQNLTEYYNQKRVQLQLASKDTFVEKDCLIFIDNLINSRGIVDSLRQNWQEDGGSGLYPPPSLQSLLRTYLLDGPDLIFKHSLVTYTFLDIAMTLDQNNEVIKLLFKFPQIFNLSQSQTKIIQGFWHLDHDHYETALDCILDASISPEDLKPWHHSVMMKTLLTQDRSSLALWYLQVRKPAIQEEKDLLTVISLLVSKNLLDEAFEFRLRHRGSNDNDLLNHIFNECNKNELLHCLLCRSFTAKEEQAFLKYLQGTKNPKCEDLKVYYYLLRSRFLEAFDAYALSKRRQPDSQGLMGQREASTADNLVQMYKSLLPDVSSKLVELVRKERTNLWKEVPKPKPLSVFVHNAKDKVQYKSSVIFAALSKAKQTFNDTLNETKSNEIITEETPFLRTPLVSKNKTNESTPVLKYKIVGDNEDYHPSPPKRRKLSPRASKSSPNQSRNLSLSIVQSQLSTPIIVRHKRQTINDLHDTVLLPQSILKSSTALESSIFNENYLEHSARRSALGLSPRTSVRSTSKSHVQFSGIGSSGNSSLNNTGLIESLESDMKNSIETSVDDEFYSPEHSFEERNKTVKDDGDNALPISGHQSKEKLNFDDSANVDEQPATSATPEEVISDKNTIPAEENVLITKRFDSPKCRRSIRRSISDSPTPIRFSPRLAKKSSEANSTRESSAESINNEIKSVPTSPSVQKLHGRQSLSRAVLENNLLKSLYPPVDENVSAKFQISCSSISDISFDDSLTTSLEEDQDSDTSLKVENVEVVSKVTEVSHVEIHRESLSNKDTVSTKESKMEYHSKTVEEFRDDDKNTPDDNIDLQQETVEEDKQESLDKQTPVDHQSESEESEEALNIYEDLSSASEDAKEVLQNVTKEKELMCDRDPDELVIQENLDVDETIEDIPEAEKAFINTGEVIEIDSSSAEESGNISPRLFSSQNSSTSEFEQELGATEACAKQYQEEESSNHNSESYQISDVEDCDTDVEIGQQEDSSDSELAEACKPDPEEDSSNQNSASEHSFRNSDVLELSKHNWDEKSSSSVNEKNISSGDSHISDLELSKRNSEENSLNSCNDNDICDSSDVQIVKHVVGDDDSSDCDNSKSNDGILNRATLVEDNQQKTDDTVVDENPLDDTSKEDEDSDVDDSPLQERMVTPASNSPVKADISGMGSSEYSESPDKLQNISSQDVATNLEITHKNSEEEISPVASEKQSRSIQCTLPILSSEEDGEPDLKENQLLHTPNVEAATLKLRTVKKTYGRKCSASTDEGLADNIASDEEPKLRGKQSIGQQCNFETPDVTEAECVEATTIKVKTVKKTYKGPKTAVDLDATPKLTVSFPVQTYSKTRLFEKNEDVDDKENATVQMEVEENVVVDQEIGNIDKNIDENNENVVHEEIAHIDKDVVAQEEIVNMEENDAQDREVASEKGDVKLDATCSEQDKDEEVIPSQLETVKEVTEEKNKTDATPIRMTRRRSLLMSQESSECSENIKEKGDLETTITQSNASSQSSDRRRSERFLSSTQEKQNSRDTSPRKGDLVEQEVENLKTEEDPPKQKTKNKRKSKKILSDIDVHSATIDFNPEETTQKQEASASKTEDLANSTNVYARRTTRTSKTRDAPISLVKSTEKPPPKRTRSLSSDQPVTRKKNFRTKSFNDELFMDRERNLRVVLTPFDQISGGSTSKAKSKASSRVSSRKRSTDDKKLPAIEEINPINLLDKVEFKGQPDPDEAKVYEEDVSLPPSPGSYSRQTRSTSVLSNASSIKSRLRRPSVDTVSEADSASPPKRNKKKDVEESSPKSVRYTRSRVNSTSSLKSDTSTTRNTRARSRRPSVLEDIKEEQGSDEEKKGGEKSNVKKRGRKRKE